MSFSRITAYQLEEFLKSHPEFLKEIIRELYKETAIEFKERLTSKETAEYLNISVKTLDNLCWERKIPFYKLGKSREFLLKDLKQYRLNKEKYIPSLY
jgi:excisionase family DNA binding protein